MVTSPEVSLFPVMSCHRAIGGGYSFYISHVISSRYQAFPDLGSVFDTGAHPGGILSRPSLDRTMFTDTFNL